MIELFAKLSPISGETFFVSLIFALTAFIFVPIAVTFWVKSNRRRGRRGRRRSRSRR